jgi:hypothetical protein
MGVLSNVAKTDMNRQECTGCHLLFLAGKGKIRSIPRKWLETSFLCSNFRGHERFICLRMLEDGVCTFIGATHSVNPQ